MQRLIEFITRFRFFFLFVALEAICFVILFTNNPIPSAWYFTVSSHFRGWSQTASSDLTDFFYLKNVNKELANQNVTLLKESSLAFIKMDSAAFSLSDLSKFSDKKQFDFIPAKVVGNSMYQSKNTLLLNKGSLDNIKKNMGVISPTGIVGSVVGVSENYSVVLPLLNKASLVSAKIIPGNHMGTISWDGKDARIVIMRDIPTHIKLNKGDTIVTSGFSLMFPENVTVGTIKDYELDVDKSYYRIQVNLSTDFRSLQWVYIVNNLSAEEQSALIETAEKIKLTTE